MLESGPKNYYAAGVSDLASFMTFLERFFR